LEHRLASVEVEHHVGDLVCGRIGVEVDLDAGWRTEPLSRPAMTRRRSQSGLPHRSGDGRPIHIGRNDPDAFTREDIV